MKTKTTEEFKKEIIDKYGDKYGLSKVIYKDSHTKILIRCKNCGNEFSISPTNLLSGKGCPFCKYKKVADAKRIPKEQIIKRIEETNHFNYDYSQFNVSNQKEKGTVICHNKDKDGNEHGIFFKTAWHLIDGCGCPKCASEKLRQKKINAFNEINNSGYELIQDSFKTVKQKALFVCQKHGTFTSKPYLILKGQKCPICLKEKQNKIKEDSYNAKQAIKDNLLEKRKLNFIERAMQIHGSKYDYSEVNYVNSITKVSIICPDHGEFWQTPANHLQGKGCPKCVGKNKTTDDFKKEATKIHNAKYDYSKVSYVSATLPVEIICPIHGSFFQTPNKHLSGEGCPACKMSHLENFVKNYLDIHNIRYIYQYKTDWLGLQSLDFYLPDYNTAIECQGRQHFTKDNYYFGAKNIDDEFNKTLNRDKIKNLKCSKNNVNILYFTNVKNIDLSLPIYNKIYNKQNLFNNIDSMFEILLK